MGRNLASMELLIIISTIMRRYSFVLEDHDKPVRLFFHSVTTTLFSSLISLRQFATREGFLRKPLECRVGMKRREL